MLMSLGSAAIGLVFGWCVMLLSAESEVPFWGRSVLSAAIGTLAAVLFDYIAFEGGHLAFWALGGALGGVIAVGAHHGITSGLERRPRRKNPASPNEAS